MCELIDARNFLETYNHDLDTARADGAEREFLEAEAVLEDDRIEQYDLMTGIRDLNTGNYND